MSTHFRRVASVSVAVLITASALAACGANDAQEGDDDSAGTIALLLPESKTTRYEAFDRPIFEAKVKELCPDCTVDYYNADQDAEKQAQQVDSAIAKGADVMVLDPVNGEGATSMVQSAQESGAEVIAYDRFIEGADYYLSFDNETVGELQAQALVDELGDKGDILMLNGAPDDPNAADFKKGAHNVIDKSGLKVLDEYDNPDWSPDNAQQWTNDQIGRFGKDKIDGVYAANDGQAGGVYSALTGAGFSAKDVPPITGQDAELAGIQRIVAGEQAMTIFKSYFVEADKAAETAVQLVKGEDVTGTTDFNSVKSFIFDPVVVTQDNIKENIVDTGLYTVEDICTDDYAKACAAIGLE